MDLIEIKGKINTAICYARVVEDEAIEQIRRMCDYPMTEGSRIRIMPDVHSGKGCTIGTTMTITDKAVPNVVGVDIGCGMYTVNLGKVDIDFVKVDEVAHFIPSGMNVWEGRQERFDLTELACYRELKDTKRLERSLGTLLIKVEGILPSPAEAETEEEMFTMPTIDMVATGRNIMRLREATGLTVRDLQDIFGFATPQAIYKWQHGTAMPTIDNLVVLAAVLDVPMDEIIIIDINRTKQISA